jgi:hypothetical protein
MAFAIARYDSHKRYILLAMMLVALLHAALGQTSSDDKAVRAVINQYFRGHATGDPVEMRKAFHPTAHVEGNRDGKFVSWTAEQYAGNFTGKPAADEASRKRTIDRVGHLGRRGDGQRHASCTAPLRLRTISCC